MSTTRGQLERVGGATAHDLYEIAVTHPSARTFRLAKANLSGVLSEYDDLVLADSPVAYWKLAEDPDDVSGSGGTASDATGNGHDGTYTDGVTLGVRSGLTGDTLTGAYFNGTDDDVAIPHDAAFNSTSRTTEFWFRAPDAPASDFIGLAAKAPDTGVNRSIMIHLLKNTRKLRAQPSDGTITHSGIDTVTDVADGQFHHIVVRLTPDAGGDIYAIFVDGVKDVEVQQAGFVTVQNTNEIVLGKLGSASSAGRHFTGTMARVAIYDRALTSTEIWEHYRAGADGLSWHGIVTGSSGAIATAPAGGLTQDGTLSLTLADVRGTFGQDPLAHPRRKFSDHFTIPTALGEPLELRGATVTAKQAVRLPSGTWTEDTLGQFRVETVSKDHSSGLLALNCVTDSRFLTADLPKRSANRDLFSSIGERQIGQPIPLAYGEDLVVPGIVVDPGTGRVVFTESPTDTPVELLNVIAPLEDPALDESPFFRLESPVQNPIVEVNEEASAFFTPSLVESFNTGNGIKDMQHSFPTHGKDGLLVVDVLYNLTAAGASTVTTEASFNGRALTFLQRLSHPTAALTLDRMYLLMPDAGTHTLRVVGVGGADMKVGATNWLGVDQAVVFDDTQTGTGTGTTATVNVSASAANVVDGLGKIGVDGLTVGADQTARYSEGEDGFSIAGSTEPGAATVTMSWTWGTSRAWIIMASAIAFTTNTQGWRELTEIGQTFPLEDGRFLDSLEFWLRPFSGDPLPAGDITLRLEAETEDVASGDLIARNAQATYDASLITQFQRIRIDLRPVVIAPPRRIAATLRYAPSSGGGRLEIRYSSAIGYNGGVLLTRANDDWLRESVIDRQIPPEGLEGDGVVAGLSIAGSTVHDFLELIGEKVLIAGTFENEDRARAGIRGFLRIDVSELPALTGSDKAYLVLFLIEHRAKVSVGAASDDSLQGDLLLEEIADFTTLDDGDYAASVVTDFGVIANAQTSRRFEIKIDISTRYTAAKSGTGILAFRVRNSNETPNVVRWYAIASRESGDQRSPRVEIAREKEAVHFRVNARQFTLTNSSADELSELDIGAAVDEQSRFGVAMHGMSDDGSGTYTGTALARIHNGSDILRHLALHSRALGLAASRLDTDTLDEFRSLLSTSWHPLAGLVYQVQPAGTWLARVARSAASQFFLDSAGRITMGSSLLRQAAPVLTVHPSEFAELAGSDEAGIDGPWTDVTIFFGRDLFGIAPRDGDVSDVAEWDGKAFVRPDGSMPSDATREAKALALKGRHGDHPMSSGVSEENSFHFTPRLSIETPAAIRLLRRLFDRGSRVPDSQERLTLALPRAGLVVTENDEVDLYAFSFPSEIPSGPTTTWDVDWDVDWSSARRGRFRTISTTRDIEAGPDWPARLTLELLEWRTP